MKQNTKSKRAAARIAVTGVMTGLVMAFTYFGVNLGTAYVNLGDAMVLTAGALFGPLTGMVAGGLGAMLMDLIVFPATFVFTLFIKGIEGALCGLLVKYALPKLTRGRHAALQAALGTLAMLLCALVMATGYFGTNVLFWGEGDSPATRLSGALLQLPVDIAQGAVGCAIAVALVYVIRLDKIAARFGLGNLVITGKKPPAAEQAAAQTDEAAAGKDLPPQTSPAAEQAAAQTDEAAPGKDLPPQTPPVAEQAAAQTDEAAAGKELPPQTPSARQTSSAHDGAPDGSARATAQTPPTDKTPL